MNVDIGRSGGEKNMLGENVEAEVIEGSTISDQRDMRIKGCDDDLDIITRWEDLFTNNSSEGQEHMLANPCLLHKVIHCYTRQREKGELSNDSIKIADILNKAAGMGVTTQKDATKAAVVNIADTSVSMEKSEDDKSKLRGEKNTTLMASANDDGNRNNTMIVNVGHDEILGRDTVATPMDVAAEKIVLESAVMLNTAKHDMKMDKIEGFTIDKRRTNLTFNGITYNCTKCTRGKLPDEFTKYYSCTMVYRECEGKWKPRRQTKDKVDSDKEKCGGTLVVHYTHSDNFVVKARTEHRCSGQS
jgi:hypothetical protein